MSLLAVLALFVLAIIINAAEARTKKPPKKGPVLPRMNPQEVLLQHVNSLESQARTSVLQLLDDYMQRFYAKIEAVVRAQNIGLLTEAQVKTRRKRALTEFKKQVCKALEHLTHVGVLEEVDMFNLTAIVQELDL